MSLELDLYVLRRKVEELEHKVLELEERLEVVEVRE